MLKKIIDSLEGLDEKYHDLYEKQADGKYHLKVEDDDAAAIKRARDHEKEARQTAEAEIKELKKTVQELKDAQDTGHRKSGDIEALEKSWQEKLATKEAELNERIKTLETALSNEMAGSVATSMAAELAGKNSSLLLPHIERRLTSEVVDGVAKTVVLSEKGERSALTVEELKKEVLSNDLFKPILLGSQANGSGASGGQGGGADQTKNRKFSELSSAEKVALKRKDPDSYEKLRDEHRAEQAKSA